MSNQEKDIYIKVAYFAGAIIVVALFYSVRQLQYQAIQACIEATKEVIACGIAIKNGF